LKLYRPFWEIVQLGFANSDHPKYHSSFVQKKQMIAGSWQYHPQQIFWNVSR